MTNTLAAQQQALQAAVIGATDASQLLQPGSRLNVYVHAYRARLMAALQDNFEVLYHAMGDEAFEALALAYLQAHPSPHRSIRWFGHRLAEFMASDHAVELPHPALIDFAHMDWALRGAFDAAAEPPLRTAELAALPAAAWPALRFTLQPSVTLLRLDWAIEPVWAALRAAPSATELPALAPPRALAHTLLVWRQGLETRWRSLEPLEAGLLALLRQGAHFEALCEQAAEAPAVVACLQQWLADELLASKDRPIEA